MGGSVGVTLRYPDGFIKKMSRWTNSLPWFIVNADFITANPKHIAEWMQAHEKMEKDYELNKENKKFKYPTTATDYEPWNLLAPIEYGLVVLDMQQQKIYSVQDYTSFSSMMAFMANPRICSDTHERVIKLFEQGHLTKVEITQSFRKTSKDVWEVGTKTTKKIKSKEEIDEIIKADIKRHADHSLIEDNWHTFKFDWPPWKLAESKPSLAAFKRMKKSLIADGWNLTQEENEVWNSFLQKYFKESYDA